MAAVRPSAAGSTSRSASGSRSYARHAARIIANMQRISDTCPNCVWLDIVETTLAVMASLIGNPLIEAASSKSQITPDATVMASPVHAIPSVCVRSSLAAVGSERNAGFTTTARKISVPVVSAEAAKWTARTATRGPPIPAPNQSIELLTDLEREIAIGRMGIHRKHMPRHVVCSIAPRAQRDRHLVAAD